MVRLPTGNPLCRSFVPLLLHTMGFGLRRSPGCGTDTDGKAGLPGDLISNVKPHIGNIWILRFFAQLETSDRLLVSSSVLEKLSAT